jgi:serine/threonine-protein kinase
MTSDRREQVERLYRAAQDRSAHERAAFLADACAGDEALRREVESLLDNPAATSAFLKILGAAAAQLIGEPISADETGPVPGVPRQSPSRLGGPFSQFGPLEDARFAPGHIFASRYRIVSLLGRGGMGEVYRAEDLRLGQAVALKLMSGSLPQGRENVRRFISEVRLARGITHPNVCRVYDIGDAEGWHYLSMEYVDGETLESLLRRIGRLPPEKSLDIARQLCAGLAAAHDRGVLHRDLKPANIMVDGRGRIRIMDFGLAVSTREGAVSEVAGTPGYMAPEQLRRERITERTDLYALGLILYEIFAGRRVFGVRTLEERMLLGSPPIPSFNSEIDSRVAAIIRACLASDPNDRPQGALSVAALLPGGDQLAAALAAGQIPPPEVVAAASKTGALRPSIAWSLLIAVVAGSVGVAAWAEVLNIAPAVVPKPPEALAERAKDLLRRTGQSAAEIDNEFWFATGTDSTSPSATRFLYRESPRYLIPANLFHIVTETDPPADVDGNATVMLDTSGKLIRLARISDRRITPDGAAPDWTTFFVEAGLNEREFVRVEPDRTPLVPHDSLVMWERRLEPLSPVRVIAASHGGRAVYFEVAAVGAIAATPRAIFSTGQPARVEALLWIVVISIFITAAVITRRNLRAGVGDPVAALKLAIFMGILTVVSGALRAHHVPIGVEEAVWLLGVSGWGLLWAGFSWMAYVSFEPYLRRRLPRTLISWTRLLSGRVRDPLVGRDVLVGLVAAVGLTALLIARMHATGIEAPQLLMAPVLRGLQSPRATMAMIASVVQEGFSYGVGLLFCLVTIRQLVRKTWIAVALLMIAGSALTPGAVSGVADLPFIVLFGLIVLLTTVRFGLLTAIVMQIGERLLTRSPLTLHTDSWYFGLSLVILMLVSACAIYGFIAALAGRPAFGAHVAAAA